MSKTQLTLGGQAVVEGVLMKTAKQYAVAVRLKNNKILMKQFPFVSWAKRFRGLNLPLVRGVVVLAETLVVGLRALTFSANKAGEEKEEVGFWGLLGTLVFSLLFVVMLFKVVPLWLAGVVQRATSSSYSIFTVVDGLLKVFIFLVYLLLIGQFKDVKRLFGYHGAEHMAVHCYEKGLPLTVENVKKFSPEHPRCGTAFILLVLLISIIIYLFIPQGASFWSKLFWRIALLPVIAGISYELLRLGGKYADRPGLAWLNKPGLLLQRFTTRRPDKGQMEVAICSLQGVLRKAA